MELSELNNITLGCMGFSYKTWKGTFYPESIDQKDLLPSYAERFNSVEVDSTWYFTPRKSTVQRWYEVTPEGFTFTAKVPKNITHEKRDMRECVDDFVKFVEPMLELKEKLRCLLFQFPYGFTYTKNAEAFAEFLAELPKDVRYAVEMRNRKWLNEDYFSLLREHNVAHVLQEYPKMPRDIILTADFSYVRILGDRYHYEAKHGEDFSQLRESYDDDLRYWAEKIAELALPVLVYFNNHFEGHSPETLRRFHRLIRDITGE